MPGRVSSVQSARTPHTESRPRVPYRIIPRVHHESTDFNKLVSSTPVSAPIPVPIPAPIPAPIPVPIPAPVSAPVSAPTPEPVPLPVTTIMMNDSYHQRQIGSNCRLHAINNLVGKEICTIPEFEKICSKWDAENNITGELSRTIQIFYNNGNAENIFGKVLRLKGYNISLIGYDFHENKPPIPGHALGAILFNQGHTWSVRKHSDGQWWVHDSMRGPYPYRHVSNRSFAMLHVLMI